MCRDSIWPPLVICLFLAVAPFGALNVVAEEPLPQVERLRSSPVLRHLKPNPVTVLPPGTVASAADQAIQRMYVPEGFKVEVIAAEPVIHQPVAFAWDDLGRLWIVEAHSYPAKRAAGAGLDRVVILEDQDGDGRFESRKVFIEGLNLASGIEVGYGGVWIGAAPELLFLPDVDQDDRPDGPPEVVLDGFGFQDTHETLNSFVWGPDGWLYGNQGVFNTARIGKPGVPSERRPELRAGVWRFHPVRREFEIFSHGGSNPWGLDYDEQGQLFTTHCRSYWGRGLTTHQTQGGHFWNQVNANYAPFILADPPADFPELRNYMLASARYDHGAGGAGPKGSDAIYGGHSHVGTMIYLGDNWPAEHRGRLFTHNLGGHQINQQINQPLGSSYDTVHAGQDMLFCTDPTYVAVDLSYGPDGAVYLLDWVDPQHCHNPNTERWDRGNGRVYRMAWQPAFRPVKVNLRAKSDLELAQLQDHSNQWHARIARRLLHERFVRKQPMEPAALARLEHNVRVATNSTVALNSLWALHLLGGLKDDMAAGLANAADAWLRAWSIQLVAELKNVPNSLVSKWLSLAKQDASPVVRRYLASALQRLPAADAWPLAEALACRGEDVADRHIPYLLWQGLAPLMEQEPKRAFALAESAQLPQLVDWVYWYGAARDGAALNSALARIGGLTGDALHKGLACLWSALEPGANQAAPEAWIRLAPGLYGNSNLKIRRLAQRIGAVFGDSSAFPDLRAELVKRSSLAVDREHAFVVLARARDVPSVPLMMRLLDENRWRLRAIKVLAQFDDPAIGGKLIERFGSYAAPEKDAALAALISRTRSASLLLDAVQSKAIDRHEISAYYIRRLAAMNDSGIRQRVTAIWGPVQETPALKRAQIERLVKVFDEAPLWAYSGKAGAEHFTQLCATCHGQAAGRGPLGPTLTGSGKHGVRYFLENIVDPDAVIGADYEAVTLELASDESVSGLLAAENPSAVTIRTTLGERVIAKAEIRKRNAGGKSLMPEGLLDGLNEREQIELLKVLVEQ